MGFLDDLMKRLTKGISQFVAFLFFVFTAGMLYGLFVSRLEPILLFIPPLMGLVAYYNEKLALLLFAGLFILLL